MLILPICLALAAQDPTPPAPEPSPPAPEPAPPAPAAPPAPKTVDPAIAHRIVVAGFRADGVDPAVARQVEDVLAMEIAKFEGVDVVSRTEVEQALDAAARNQMLGCADDACLIDVAKLLPARLLLAGSVGAIGGRTIVNASLLDLVEGKSVARVSMPLGDSADDAFAALRSVALSLLGQGPTTIAGVTQGEVTADMLERVRIAERPRSLYGRVIGGALLAASPLATYGFDPSNLGGAGRADVMFAVLPWLALGGGLGGGYYTGQLVEKSQFLLGDPNDDIELAGGEHRSTFGVADVFGDVAVELKRPTGLVLPYVRAAVTLDYLVWDASDLEFQQDDDLAKAPPEYTKSIPFKQSTSLGVGGVIGGGVDFIVLDHLGLTLDLSAYGKGHGLEKRFLVQNVEQVQPIAPLFGMQLFAGVRWQL